jgi:hypothetical protein
MSESDEWNIDDAETFLAACESCGVVRPVQLLSDPLIEEVYPEDENEAEYYCKECWQRRHGEI